MNEQTHTISKRSKKSFFTLYDLAKIGFFFFGFPENTFGSVDVTNDCNLRCEHCYFFEQDHPTQWSVEQWKDKFERMKAAGFRFYSCTWVGGEPLMRKPVIELGRQYFIYNTVVTIGSIPLPDWKDVIWYVSIDGGKKHHERMRNKPGLYDRIKRTIEGSYGLEITIAYCITHENYTDIPEVLEEWSQNPRVMNMVFSFYTPIKGLDEGLWLGWEERDRVIELLIEKKRHYGEFIANTERVLRLMKSDNSRSVTDNCPFAAKSFALSPTGDLKEPCMMGPKADCDRCGCVVPFYMKSLTDRKLILSDLAVSAVFSIHRGISGFLNGS
jgi:Fe-coproporphyrin III synthase